MDASEATISETDIKKENSEGKVVVSIISDMPGFKSPTISNSNSTTSNNATNNNNNGITTSTTTTTAASNGNNGTRPIRESNEVRRHLPPQSLTIDTINVPMSSTIRALTTMPSGAESPSTASTITAPPISAQPSNLLSLQQQPSSSANAIPATTTTTNGFTLSYQPQQRQQQQQALTKSSRTNLAPSKKSLIVSASSLPSIKTEPSSVTAVSAIAATTRDRHLLSTSTRSHVIDFAKFEVSTLKKYKKFYHIRTKHNSTKAELASAVNRHFLSQPLNEIEAITYFVYAVRNQGNTFSIHVR
jgi:hypothetical protein